MALILTSAPRGTITGAATVGRLTRSSDAPVLGPSTSISDTNAMIEIHDDNLQCVRDAYADFPRLRFQFIGDGGGPTSIQSTGEPRWESMPVMGRSEDYMSYAGTENKKINIDLSFLASAEQGDSGTYDTAVRCARWLESLKLPVQQPDGLLTPPPLCLLILGRFIAARGIVTACPITYEGPFVGQFEAFEYPVHCRASLEFTIVNRVPKTAQDMLNSLRANSLTGL